MCFIESYWLVLILRMEVTSSLFLNKKGLYDPMKCTMNIRFFFNSICVKRWLLFLFYFILRNSNDFRKKEKISKPKTFEMCPIENKWRFWPYYLNFRLILFDFVQFSGTSIGEMVERTYETLTGEKISSIEFHKGNLMICLVSFNSSWKLITQVASKYHFFVLFICCTCAFLLDIFSNKTIWFNEICICACEWVCGTASRSCLFHLTLYRLQKNEEF